MRVTLMTLLILVATAIHATEKSPDEPVSLEAVWELVQGQQAQIAQLTAELKATKAQLKQTDSKVQITEEQLVATADYVDEVQRNREDSRTSIGGYGEMHYNNLDADDSDNDLKEVDYHRFVMFFGHEFTDRIRFFSEVELEHALVKDTADGSSGGEVELEQAYIEMDLDDNHYTRSGLFIVPVGIINETHEPQTFYGVERNDVESIIIPATWWEGGAGVGGRYGNGLSWDFAVHSGLEMPTTGSSAFQVRSGRQKVSNAVANDLAYTLRLKYTGVPGLELAGTYHYEQDPTQTSGDGLDEGQLISVHSIFSRGPFSLRALWARWDFDGESVELANADQQTGWYVEPSVRLNIGEQDWGFYTRYEDVRGARDRDRFDQWELGFNYWPTEEVVFKFDYRDRSHDLDSESGRDFNGFDLGVGYQF